MPVTTTDTLFEDGGGLKAFNDETQAVLNQLAGYKTKGQRLMEFFGIHHNDLQSHNKLEKLGVYFHPRLAEMGLTQDDFNTLTDGYEPKTGTGSKNTGSEESEGSSTVQARGRKPKASKE